MASSRPAGDASPATRKTGVTILMIVTAFAGVLLTILCADALIAAFVWAMLAIGGAAMVVIEWTEGAIFLISLVPAVWLFRQAMQTEREIAGLAPESHVG